MTTRGDVLRGNVDVCWNVIGSNYTFGAVVCYGIVTMIWIHCYVRAPVDSRMDAFTVKKKKKKKKPINLTRTRPARTPECIENIVTIRIEQRNHTMRRQLSRLEALKVLAGVKEINGSIVQHANESMVTFTVADIVNPVEITLDVNGLWEVARQDRRTVLRRKRDR